MTQQELPPAPFLPPLTDVKAIERAMNVYVQELHRIEMAQFDHLVETHSGFWHLNETDRWLMYTQGPEADFRNLQQRAQQEQMQNQELQQQQMLMAAEGGKGEPPVPPTPLLRPQDHERLQLYLRGEDEWYLVWLLGLTREEPKEGERMMRDYASLSLKFGKVNGNGNTNQG